MLWGLLICLVSIILIIFSIKRSNFFRIEGIPQRWIYAALALKILAAGFLFFLYTNYYSNRADADIFKYYDDALIIKHHKEFSSSIFFELLHNADQRGVQLQRVLQETQHWDRGAQLLPNDNRTMIILNLLLLGLSNEFYFFHLLVFSFLSFIGGIGMLHFFKGSSTIPSQAIFLAVFLAPSVCLWTSGLLKESLFICFFGMFLYSLALFKQKLQWKVWPLLLFSLLFLTFLKSYLLICFLPALLIYLLSRIGNKGTLLLGVSVILVFILILQDVLLQEVIRVQQNFMELAEKSEANSRFTIETIRSFQDLLLGIPQALYNVWLRPIFVINSNPFSMVNASESAVYVLMWFLPLWGYKRDWRKDKSLLIMSITYVLISSILIGSSIPIVGAIVRYRSPILIFYLLTVFTFVDWNKLQHRIR